MKRFEFVVMDDGTGNKSALNNEGYTCFELIALLELKKKEIIDIVMGSTKDVETEVYDSKGE